MEALIANGADELVDAPHVQTPEAMRAEIHRLPRLHAALEELMNALPFAEATPSAPRD